MYESKKIHVCISILERVKFVHVQTERARERRGQVEQGTSHTAAEIGQVEMDLLSHIQLDLQLVFAVCDQPVAKHLASMSV